jgi:large subunit ribosomal protein L40
MREACEALRNLDADANIVVDGQGKKDVGRLYRIAMMKNDIWGGVPIEYARIQTDSPSKDGWNHEWTR